MYTTLISVNDLQQQYANPDWVIVDCRFDLSDPEQGRRDYLEAHIPGALYADIDHDLSAQAGSGGGRHPLPDAESLVALFSRLGIDGDCQVVAYDAVGGGFAARLWWLLRYMGHEAVAVLDGGWPAWLAAGGETCSGEETRSARDFRGEPNDALRIPIDAVGKAPLLVDSRDPARYRGEFEPLDPAAGHIPGAYNRFWKHNLGEGDHFRPAAELAQEFSDLFHGQDPEAAVFYCGSGVTACHNVLAAVHAGLPQPRLYAGSWSEWCADSARPVATGSDIDRVDSNDA